ncbi:MAG: guanylate kinase [Clostridia bacterium]|nr:guanylate kinase [Clostridia bacterium]
MNKGRLFIISGPSGSGKDTILIELFKRIPSLKFSISSITRDMRKGEKPGEKYNFISREEFENMISNDQLLEYNCFVDNYYGTPKAPVLEAINSGNDIIVEVDVNGAKQIREKMPESISIFVMPPDLKTLKARLCARGTESPKKIEERMISAKTEIERANEYDHIVVNDTVENAVEKIAAIINK